MCYRGTHMPDTETAFANWKANFDFLPVNVSCKGGKLVEDSNGVGLHRGFFGAYEASRQPVRDALSKTSVQKVLVTGHSLGGAMATLCAMELCLPELYEVFLVTFGAPRLGGPPFQRLYQDVLRLQGFTARLQGTDDPVPQVPPVLGHPCSGFKIKKEDATVLKAGLFGSLLGGLAGAAYGMAVGKGKANSTFFDHVLDGIDTGHDVASNVAFAYSSLMSHTMSAYVEAMPEHLPGKALQFRPKMQVPRHLRVEWKPKTCCNCNSFHPKMDDRSFAQMACQKAPAQPLVCRIYDQQFASEVVILKENFSSLQETGWDLSLSKW